MIYFGEVEVGLFSKNPGNLSNDDIITSLTTPRVCCEDMLATIDAMVESTGPLIYIEPKNSHLSSPSWTRISGSSDPLTVLLYLDSFTRDNCHVLRGYLRVVNTSGFKIPSFDIKILTKTTEQSIETHDGSFCQPLLANDCIIGGRYMRPLSIIDRDFELSLSSFQLPQLKIRIVYTELEEESEQEGFASQANNSATRLSRSESVVSAQSQQTAVSTCEEVDCRSVSVGICQLLQPYGKYNFSAFTSLESLRKGGGIPPRVFRRQWDRLSLSSKLSVRGEAISLLDQSAILAHVNASDVTSQDFVSLFEMISISSPYYYPEGSDVSMTVLTARVRLDDGQRPASDAEVLAWSFQTHWGDEFAAVANMLRVHSKASGHDSREWIGSIELRFSSEELKFSVLKHNDKLESFVRDISCGVLRLNKSSKKNLKLF